LTALIFEWAMQLYQLQDGFFFDPRNSKSEKVVLNYQNMLEDCQGSIVI